MKSMKDLNWKHWLIIYLAFMVVISIVGGLFQNFNINIHSGFIFITVLFIHFLIVVERSTTLRMKHMVMAFVVLILIQTTITEFYGKPLALYLFGYTWDVINSLFVALAVIFIISFIKNKLKERKENKRKLKEIINNQPNEEIDVVAPEELSKEKE